MVMKILVVNMLEFKKEVITANKVVDTANYFGFIYTDGKPLKAYSKKYYTYDILEVN